MEYLVYANSTESFMTSPDSTDSQSTSPAEVASTQSLFNDVTTEVITSESPDEDDEEEDEPLPQEQRLMNKLMENYEFSVRPVKNASATVNVRMGLTLTQIFDMVSNSLNIIIIIKGFHTNMDKIITINN